MHTQFCKPGKRRGTATGSSRCVLSASAASGCHHAWRPGHQHAKPACRSIHIRRLAGASVQLAAPGGWVLLPAGRRLQRARAQRHPAQSRALAARKAAAGVPSVLESLPGYSTGFVQCCMQMCVLWAGHTQDQDAGGGARRRAQAARAEGVGPRALWQHTRSPGGPGSQERPCSLCCKHMGGKPGRWRLVKRSGAAAASSLAQW